MPAVCIGFGAPNLLSSARYATRKPRKKEFAESTEKSAQPDYATEADMKRAKRIAYLLEMKYGWDIKTDAASIILPATLRRLLRAERRKEQMKKSTTVLIFVVGFFLGAMTIHSRTAAAQGGYNVSPVIQTFDVWGGLDPHSKLIFYSGWSNGLFTTTKDPAALALGRCLENLSFEQIVAMVDKRFADNREAIHNPVGTEIIKALTVAGGPCESITVDLETKNVACAADKSGSVSCYLVTK